MDKIQALLTKKQINAVDLGVENVKDSVADERKALRYEQLKQKQNKKPDRSEKTLLRSGHFISKFIRCFLFAAFFTFPKVHNRDEHRFHLSNRENSGCRRSSKRGKDVYPHRIFRTSIRHKAHLRDFFSIRMPARETLPTLQCDGVLYNREDV